MSVRQRAGNGWVSWLVGVCGAESSSQWCESGQVELFSCFDSGIRNKIERETERRARGS